MVSGLTATLYPQSGWWSIPLSASSISLPSFTPLSHHPGSPSQSPICFSCSLKHVYPLPHESLLFFLTVSRTTSCRSLSELNPTQHKPRSQVLLTINYGSGSLGWALFNWVAGHLFALIPCNERPCLLFFGWNLTQGCVYDFIVT